MVYLKNLSSISISFIKIIGTHIRVAITAAYYCLYQSAVIIELVTMYKLSTISK